MRITITGGHGFIGTVTKQMAEERGHSVMVVDRHDGQDIRDMTAQDAGDAVIHLAGVLGTAELFDAPFEAIDVNISGSLAVIQACEKADAHLVQITMPSVWRNVYQATKRCAVDLADAWCEHRGLQVTHVRAFNVYGPGQHVQPVRKIVPTFATRAWRGLPVEIWGNGHQMVDLIHVDQIARILVLAAEVAEGKGETIDAGVGSGFTVNQVAQMALQAADGFDPMATHDDFYPTWEDYGRAGRITHHPMRQGESVGVGRTVGECANWDMLGFQRGDLRFDFEKFKETVDWYRDDRP